MLASREPTVRLPFQSEMPGRAQHLSVAKGFTRGPELVHQLLRHRRNAKISRHEEQTHEAGIDRVLLRGRRQCHDLPLS